MRAMALWASSLWLPGPRGSIGRRALMTLYQAAAWPLGFAPLRQLGLGSDGEPYGYVKQLATWARSGRWTSNRGVDYLATLDEIRAPVWAVRGEDDRLCLTPDIQVMLDRLQGAGSLVIAGRRAGHGARADHFSVLRDARFAPLWDEMIAFACSRPARPG
jgi:pimeloyl-ACP methyl ester carboxylesterase